MTVCLRCERAASAWSRACPHCGYSPPEVDGFPVFAPDVGAGAGFEPHYFPQLARVEDSHFWFRSRSRLVVDAVRRYFPGARSVLEIGCGVGAVLAVLRRDLPGVEVWGSDLFVEALRFAARRVPDARLLQCDARRVPFADEFDVICALDVLEHVAEDELVLGQLRRAVRPGGGIVLTVPQHRALWSAADQYARHQRRYSKRELIGKVSRAGLEVVRVTSFVSTLLPAIWLRRLIAARSLERFDPMAEFRVPRWLNAALGALLALERQAIRLGATLPAGGSLLLVARRAGAGGA